MHRLVPVLLVCTLAACSEDGRDPSTQTTPSTSSATSATSNLSSTGDAGVTSTAAPTTGDLPESTGSSTGPGTSSGIGGEPGSTGGSSGTTAAPAELCGCFAGEGPYCGHAVAEQVMTAGCDVPVLAGHEGDILRCEGDEWTVDAACAAGCEATAPGEADVCALPDCECFVKEAWCGSGAAEHGLTLDPPCRVPLVPEHNGDILGCDGAAWIVQQACDKGCHEEMLGVADSCNDDAAYRLPWKCDTKQTCSQGNNGSSHQGSQKYAWDFAMPKGTAVHAARGGVVAYLEMRSPPGSTCYDPPGIVEACHNKANFIGIRHNDGTVALYMHLREMKVKKGATVAQGQLIGLSGNSGYTSGPHLHFQLQNDCGIWFCSSVPVKFADAPKLAKGSTPTSGNCP